VAAHYNIGVSSIDPKRYVANLDCQTFHGRPVAIACSSAASASGTETGGEWPFATQNVAMCSSQHDRAAALLV
jgi:hypothetical protein